MVDNVSISADREAKTLAIEISGEFTYTEGVKIYGELLSNLKRIQGKDCPEQQSD